MNNNPCSLDTNDLETPHHLCINDVVCYNDNHYKVIKVIGDDVTISIGIIETIVKINDLKMEFR
jgi:hypothetical protein